MLLRERLKPGVYSGEQLATFRVRDKYVRRRGDGVREESLLIGG